MVEFLKNEVLAAASYLWSITIMYSQVSQASSNYVKPSHPCIDVCKKSFRDLDQSIMARCELLQEHYTCYKKSITGKSLKSS